MRYWIPGTTTPFPQGFYKFSLIQGVNRAWCSIADMMMTVLKMMMVMMMMVKMSMSSITAMLVLVVVMLLVTVMVMARCCA